MEKPGFHVQKMTVPVLVTHEPTPTVAWMSQVHAEYNGLAVLCNAEKRAAALWLARFASLARPAPAIYPGIHRPAVSPDDEGREEGRCPATEG